MQLRLGVVFALLAVAIAACGGGTLSSIGGPTVTYPTVAPAPNSATYYAEVMATATTEPLSIVNCCPPPISAYQQISPFSANLPAFVSATYPTPNPPTCSTNSNTSSCAKLKFAASVNDPVTHAVATGTPVLYVTVTTCRTTTSSQCTSGNSIAVTGFPGYAGTFSSSCPSGTLKIAETTSTSGPWAAAPGMSNATCSSNKFSFAPGTTPETLASGTFYYFEIYY